MAKGQVSDKELQAGIKSLGGLSGFSSSITRRDSPFGSDFARKPQPVAEVHLEKVVEVKPPDPVPLPAKPVFEDGEAKSDAQPSAPKRKGKAPAKLIVHPNTESRKGDAEESKAFEGVTVKMTSAMRDDVNFLAKKIQRRRTAKVERITANTIFRVAVQFFLDELKLNESDFANTEEELLALARKKLLHK